ncbi:MAG: sigma-70 family RNA polymerase sigma factor [Lachnospiraceae bacterium]|nr:sigma-70 family RNA polymerase sigma factor [Lachnospiraceae bacterium]MBQ9580689.1 sigma-70 family RNA polymerase sigma factor [Lachnospiraceae bacterium]
MQPIEEIYREYASMVYKYLISLTRDEDLAEELTQETFYQAIKSSNKYDESCKISTWLCAIAKNVLMTYRRKHPVLEDVDETEVATESAEAEAIGNVSRVELLKKIHDMEEPYKEVIYLRVFGGLSFAEIGEIIGKNENYARVTFYRGKEKLGKEVTENE